jgi:dTDP-L-rhamnose 4-epimerase
LIATLPAAYDVVVVDALVPDAHGAGATFSPALRARAHCIHADVADVTAWRDAAAGAQAVVHLAALTGTAQSAHQAERYRRANLTGTIRLCEGLAAGRQPPARLVLASSRAVYGEGPYLDPEHGEVVFPPARHARDVRGGRWEPSLSSRRVLHPVAAAEDMPTCPASVYASTKAAQERHWAAFGSRHGIATIAMRLQNVYGPGQRGTNPHAGVVAAIARGIMRDRHVELFEDGEMTRDFVHVDDVARALRWALECDGPLPRTANIGTGQRTSLRTLVELLARAAGADPTVTCSGRFRAGDVRHACADLARWREWAGPWQPIALDRGIPAYLAWWLDAPAASA